MIIQHNIPALNSYNKLSTNNKNLAKNLEKLSSGYRINRAGDDAAGLAISEKMRAQITGLETATKNAKDGIGMIQTAEGALQEVHAMLNRLVELASQASNGLYQDGTDREYINEEVNELMDAIDQISRTDFNGVELLNGTIGGVRLQGGPAVTLGADMTGGTVAINGLGNLARTFKDTGAAGTSLADVFLIDALATLTFKSGSGTHAGSTLTGSDPTLGNIFTTGTLTWGIVGETGNGTQGSVTFGAIFDETKLTTDEQKAAAAALSSVTITFEHDRVLAGNNTTIDFTANNNGAATSAFRGDGIKLQIGDKKGDDMTVAINDMGWAGLGMGAYNIGTQEAALDSIQVVNDAIDTVNRQRAVLGAQQNRLEHTINNLETTTENLTDAESRLRDTDMAKEMMAYTKNSILVQSAQAMLAQANQLPSSVLNLLY